jgi:hypothetical protein
MSHITDKAQYQPISTYHLPSAPILTVPIPNLPVSVAEKGLESLSSPPLFGGNERCILSSLNCLTITFFQLRGAGCST